MKTSNKKPSGMDDRERYGSGPRRHRYGWTYRLLILLAVVALGAFATGLATAVYFYLAKTAGAAFLSLTNYLVPIFAVAVGTLVAGEQLGVNAWAALAIILVGLAMGQRSPRVGA